jgi:hypothetical protein
MTQSRAKTDCDAKEREATADIHRISRPSEHAAGRERQCWLRRSSVCADALEDSVGADHHSDADSKGYGADHEPYQELNMSEQAQRRKRIEDNPHYQNRERDQRGEDHDVWCIAGGIGHGVIRRAWSISVRGTSTTPAPISIWFNHDRYHP